MSLQNLTIQEVFHYLRDLKFWRSHCFFGIKYPKTIIIWSPDLTQIHQTSRFFRELFILIISFSWVLCRD
jgi:hypothetical protein